MNPYKLNSKFSRELYITLFLKKKLGIRSKDRLI